MPIIDQYNRKIDYLRISVTDRCNLRCVYCMPECGLMSKSHAEILAFEEIAYIVKLAVSLGINKIRITGGEPLVRREICALVRQIADIKGVEDLSLTTNGILLKTSAAELKSAGLRRINVSLDTLRPDKFSAITRQGALSDVLEGIEQARDAGLLVKLNVVAMQGVNSEEILDFVRFAAQSDIILRFIEFMPLGDTKFWKKSMFISVEEIKEKIKSLWNIDPVTNIIGNGPARYFRLSPGAGVIGFIPALSSKFCSQCNRMRLTSDGFLLSCLGHKIGVDLKKSLRANVRPDKALALIREAAYFKPQEHDMCLESEPSCVISSIGG